MEYTDSLVKINNLLVATHPTGEDILLIAEAIVLVRHILQESSCENKGGEC